MSFTNEIPQGPRVHRRPGRAVGGAIPSDLLSQDVWFKVFLNLNDAEDQARFCSVHPEFREICEMLAAKRSMFHNKAQNSKNVRKLLKIAEMVTQKDQYECLNAFLASRFLQSEPSLFVSMLHHTLVNDLVPRSELVPYLSQALKSKDAQAKLFEFEELVDYAVSHTDNLLPKHKVGEFVNEVLVSEALQTNLFLFIRMVTLALDEQLLPKPVLAMYVSKVLDAETLPAHFYLRAELIDIFNQLEDLAVF